MSGPGPSGVDAQAAALVQHVLTCQSDPLDVLLLLHLTSMQNPQYLRLFILAGLGSEARQ
ncbi:hypothetical protein KIPB_008693, partial [Kipferlia bialata]|eukprot:g8693.t1